MFTLTPRELCNVVHTTLTAGMEPAERAEFDAAMSNPHASSVIDELRQRGVA